MAMYDRVERGYDWLIRSTEKGGYFYENNRLTFTGLTFLLFLTLKLTGHITWSWWWVTMPLWAPPAIALALGLLFVIVLITMALWPDRKKKK